MVNLRNSSNRQVLFNAYVDVACGSDFAYLCISHLELPALRCDRSRYLDVYDSVLSAVSDTFVTIMAMLWSYILSVYAILLFKKATQMLNYLDHFFNVSFVLSSAGSGVLTEQGSRTKDPLYFRHFAST